MLKKKDKPLFTLVAGLLFLLTFSLGIYIGERGLLEYQAKSADLYSEKVMRGAELEEIISNLSKHPDAINIIKCESSYNSKAYNKKTKDIGYFQINEYWHRDRAMLEGLDIDNPEDNLIYGLKLLSEARGLKYWKASEHCWKG